MKIKHFSIIKISLSLVALCIAPVLCQNADQKIIDAQKAPYDSINTNIDARQVMDVVFKTEVEEPSQDIKNQAIIEEINKKSARSFNGLGTDENEATIEFQFENADLENLVTQMAEIFEITFIKDDSISPLPQGTKSLRGSKISFKTQVPLTKKQAWNLFITFLDIAGFAIIPEADPHFFRIAATPVAQKSPIPSFIGTQASTLPDNDQLIRYLYFVENASLDTLDPIVQALRSTASSYIVLKDLNAFILTDRAYNIKSLMSIITELDRVSSPQSMSVLKLRRANAQEVKKLYDDLTKTDDKSIAARLFPARKQPTSQYFPENTRIIAEPRTNSLVLLGAQEAIAKIEEFILNHVDVELGQETRSPLHIYPLKYADAKTIAAIMNDITKFGKNTTAGRLGGVRDGDKYLKSLVFTAEPTTNRLVIRGDHEDYLQVKKIIAKLDEPQPQIAIEILILTVDLRDTRALGTQIRSKSNENLTGGVSGLLGTNVKFQTSGLDVGNGGQGIVLNNDADATGVKRLLGNLINLVVNAGPGNTAVTLGTDAFGVWGIFDVLNTVVNTQVVANPFLTVSNKQEGEVDVGTQRRVLSAQVISGGTTSESFANDKASLNVKVIPQINSDGMIVLDLKVSLSDFIDPNFSSATKTTRAVDTVAVVSDKEVLALGGLIRNRIVTSTSKTPVLGNIPILGWLFKNKRKQQIKENLLILISTHIIPATTTNAVTEMTQEHIDDYRETLMDMNDVSDRRDPIDRSFFRQTVHTEQALDDYLFQRNAEILHTQPLVDGTKPDAIVIPARAPAPEPVSGWGWRRQRRCVAKKNRRSRRERRIKKSAPNGKGVCA